MSQDEELLIVHNFNLLSSSYMDLSSAVWEMLGESSYAFTRVIGMNVLQSLETEFNLQVVDKPINVLMKDIADLFTEEFGFMGGINVEMQDEKKIVIKVDHCLFRGLCNKMVESGVKKPFNCSIMSTYAAALERCGYRMRNDIETWTEQDGSIITFTNLRSS
ncbi:MAG: hypothetical protein LWX83_07680 [Anaerolineae bacterium]|nr:hypothetical protein [Anaerolineae bacterium]